MRRPQAAFFHPAAFCCGTSSLLEPTFEEGISFLSSQPHEMLDGKKKKVSASSLRQDSTCKAFNPPTKKIKQNKEAEL